MVVWDTQPHAVPGAAPVCTLPPVSLGLSPFLVLGHLNPLCSVPTTDADATSTPCVCSISPPDPWCFCRHSSHFVSLPSFQIPSLPQPPRRDKGWGGGKTRPVVVCWWHMMFKAPFVNVPCSDFVVNPPLCNQESQRRAFGTGQHTPPHLPRTLAA